MDFGKILDQWDKKAGSVLIRNDYHPKDDEYSDKSGPSSDRITASSRRKRLLRKIPDATINLHGLTRDEAWEALSVFFNNAKNRDLEKVLIIHGKGNHCDKTGYQNSGILKKMVRDFVERCPFAGESGYSSGSKGGEGSSWVLLKKTAGKPLKNNAGFLKNQRLSSVPGK